MSMTPSRRRVEAYKLRHAAEDGRLVVYRCRRCGQVTTFIAVDLVKVWDPDMSVLVPPVRRCGKCRQTCQFEVRLLIPTSADVGTLRIRRPAGVRQLWKWDWYVKPD
jgi:hypothetical protein